jgi:putative colanic acid biosynthesis acetyltransferase WcaF
MTAGVAPTATALEERGAAASRDRARPCRYQDLARFKVAPGFRGRSGLVVLLWQTIQATVFAWSPQPAYAWRRWLLKLFGAQVGAGVIIRQTARVTYPWKVVFGDHCWIGDHAEIYSLAPITIGNNAVVSQRSYICAGTHDHHDITFPLVGRPVVIGDEAWIATDCFVAPGVRIGAGSIVAARSTVIADVPDGVIVAGGPAVVKGQRPLPTKGL